MDGSDGDLLADYKRAEELAGFECPGLPQRFIVGVILIEIE